MNDEIHKRTAQRTGATPAKDGGITKAEQGGAPSPRLPHEHDQSSDQQSEGGTTPEVGKQAYADVQHGLVDTSRALETDRAYKDMKRKPS
ncbi:MAG: hypothetical protein NVSMB34_10680 [Variovorax sp.]